MSNPLGKIVHEIDINSEFIMRFIVTNFQAGKIDSVFKTMGVFYECNVLNKDAQQFYVKCNDFHEASAIQKLLEITPIK